MRVLAYHKGRSPQIEDISNELDKLQEFVGGYIQTVTLAPNLILVCNDDGKILGLDSVAIWLNTKTNEIMDVIVGDFFLCGTTETGEDFDDISEVGISIAMRQLISVHDMVS